MNEFVVPGYMVPTFVKLAAEGRPIRARTRVQVSGFNYSDLEHPAELPIWEAIEAESEEK